MGLGYKDSLLSLFRALEHITLELTQEQRDLNPQEELCVTIVCKTTFLVQSYEIKSPLEALGQGRSKYLRSSEQAQDGLSRPRP